VRDEQNNTLTAHHAQAAFFSRQVYIYVLTVNDMSVKKPKKKSSDSDAQCTPAGGAPETGGDSAGCRQEALADSEQIFRSVAEAASDAIIIVTQQGAIYFWNDAARHIFGYTAAEVLGRPVIIIVPVRLRAFDITARESRFGSGQQSVVGQAVESVCVRKSGEEFFVEVSQYVWKRGDETFGTAIIRDISERKKAEVQLTEANETLRAREEELTALNEELTASLQQLKAGEHTIKESEERFRAIAEHLNDAMTITDSAGKILYINKAAETMFGYTRKEALGQDSTLFIPQRLYQAHDTSKDAFLAIEPRREFGTTIESLAVRKDGTEFPVDFAFSFWEIDGEMFFAGLTRDITERKRAEANLRSAYEVLRSREEELEATNEELLAQEEQLRHTNTELRESQKELQRLAAAVEQATEGIAITDLEGTFLYANPAFEQITGYTREKIIGTTLALFRPEDLDREAFSQQNTTIAAGKPWQGKLRIKVRDERTLDIDMTISPIKDTGGTIKNCVAVIRDITMDLQIERQLQQTQKMETIGTLAGGIAHDFNNILSAIMGYAEMSLARVAQEDRMHEYLQQILKASNRAKDLVKQILMFSRKHDQEKMPVQIDTVITDALKFLRASIPTTIEIRFTIKEPGGIIMANQVQMHQVLMNLCTNAAQAMAATGGVLSLELSTVILGDRDVPYYGDVLPGEYFKLSVSDTGEGIAPAVIDRIFEPFFTTKAPGKGTGMGLAVVHGIVKNHGGTITVNSVPGAETSFHVLLPKITTDIQKRHETEQTVPTGTGSILLVDDDETLINLGTDMLMQLGYSVVSAPGSLEALEAFEKNPDAFDLIITDQTMPHMTGYDLARKILDIRPAMPVILCTGYNENISEEKAGRLGIKAFIMKPVNLQEIAVTIRRVLGNTHNR